MNLGGGKRPFSPARGIEYLIHTYAQNPAIRPVFGEDEFGEAFTPELRAQENHLWVELEKGK